MSKNLKILLAALQLFVEHGFHGTPTSLIAQQAGVSNGTLFNYFKTKEDLVVALYNQVKNEASQYLTSGLEPAINTRFLFRTLFIRSLYWGLDNPQAFLYIQQFNLSPHLTRLSAEVLLEQSLVYRAFIERGVSEGTLKTMATDLIYSLVNSQLLGLFHYLATYTSSEAERDQVIEQTTDLLWEMIAN